jgi:hypothetical protein
LLECRKKRIKPMSNTTAPPDGWDRLTPDAQNEIMAGALAIRRIREHEDYSRWVAVGRALLRLQEEAMHLSGSNSPQGRGYTAIRAALGSRVPDLEELDKASKSHAVWLAKNFAAVESWRATLAVNQRDTLNHPSVVKRRYEASHSQLKDDDETAKPASPIAKLKTENVRLQEELDAANAKIRQLSRGQENLTEGRDWTWQDAEEDIATTWLRLYPDKAKRVASRVLEMSKPRSPRIKPLSDPTRPRNRKKPEVDTTAAV